jgi:hypothetical protein
MMRRDNAGGGRKMAKLLAVVLAVLAVQVSGGMVAEASSPVRKAIVGCVTGGILTSDDGYSIRVMHAQDRTAVDLSPYEGKKIRAVGNLLPGDIYFIDGAPVVLGDCRGASPQ